MKNNMETSNNCPLDDFKESLKRDIDYILEGKKSSKVQKDKVFNIISARITNYSHEVFSYENKCFKHYSGHSVRKSFRKEINQFIKSYINLKVSEMQTQENQKDGN